MDNKDLEKLTEHFFEKCPTEARNFFHQILDKLEKIEDKNGDVIVIPSNIPHSGRALTKCILMDVFSPVREEYK